MIYNKIFYYFRFQNYIKFIPKSIRQVKEKIHSMGKNPTEILDQLHDKDAESTSVASVADAERRIWWCTHGHDIPWLHFKVMTTEALLAKSGKGPLKEQYSEEHLRLLGFGRDAQPLERRSG